MRNSVVMVVVAYWSAGLGVALGADVSEKLRPEAMEARIRRHRMGELIVKTKDWSICSLF